MPAGARGLTVAVLSIRLYPDPVLRARCPEVEVFDDALVALARDMVETMHQAPGIGLAAPQVGIELRLAVVDLTVGEDPEQALTLVNPVVTAAEGLVVESEGCLSIPDFTDKVARPERIRVAARAVTGEPFEIEADELLARAIQHEIDHLDGVLFVDRLRGLRRERAKRHLRRLVAEAQTTPALAAPSAPDPEIPPP
ncbi:MAG TPA: peptide deformylase [Thermoanaerobaculia bacterium]|nr:peptide deformylase [Thermoanaerobaculia bacterium]